MIDTAFIGQLPFLVRVIVFCLLLWFSIWCCFIWPVKIREKDKQLQKQNEKIEQLSQKNTSIGGKGGNAEVGGSGIAIGGPGGKAGTYGRGGDGGSAEVKGVGIAAGGEGGSVDSDNLWSPPARSGYEVYMETTGQPIDPKMRQYGRGGMSPGYAFRYSIVEKIREKYFEAQNKTPESALENVNAVPLDYVNQELAAMGVNWRARIVRGLDYEFYVPPKSPDIQ